MTIDRKVVIESLSKIKVQGNQDGLIPGFGVLVNQLPASLWNNFADMLTNSVGPDMLEPAQYLLRWAGNECGYHTGYGIITSEEWKAVVQPMITKQPDDILHGAFAIFSAWGWAQCEIVELVAAEKMVVRAYDYYESDIVLKGQSRVMSAYMLEGVCAAFFDLAYGKKPYPDGLGTFVCTQTKGIECGDDYGEFVVTRAK
ncbi:MAG: hypothetical protein HY903_25000 [Deltaproteobacteria bacterium]|nr:hypothetical protein [Deltaproteobacteria bacterium]